MTTLCWSITEKRSEDGGWLSYRKKGASETVSRPRVSEHQLHKSPKLKPFSRGDAEELAVQPWFRNVKTRLQRFLSYEANWNGYGEQPISRQAVKRSLIVLHRVALGGPEPAVVPVFDGGIQIEWYYDGMEIEVEIPPSGRISIFMTFPDGSIVEEHTQQVEDAIWDELQVAIAGLKVSGVE